MTASQAPLSTWRSKLDALSLRAKMSVVALIAAAVLAPSLAGDFVLDDEVAIVRSRCVQDSLDLPRIFLSDFWCSPPGSVPVDSWRPLPVIIWWLLWRVAAGGPLPFKLAALLAHSACAAGIVALGERLSISGRASLLAGVAFAVLAIHMDAVASAVGLAEPLSFLAILYALWLCAPLACLERSVAKQATRTPGAPDPTAPPTSTGGLGVALGVGVATALAIASKESGAITPGLVIALLILGRHQWHDGGWRRAAIGCAGASVLACAGMIWARHLALGQTSSEHLTVTVNPLLGADLLTRALTSIDLVGRYFVLALSGSPLSADYSYNAVPITTLSSPSSLLSLTIVAGLGLVIAAPVLLARLQPGPERALVGMLTLSLLLPSNLIVLLPAIFAERLFYLPSAFFCVLLGAGAVEAFAWVRPSLARWLEVALGLWLAAQATFASLHAWAWGSSDRITEVTAESAPGSARAQLWRARVLLREGDAQATFESAEKALAILPNWAEALAVRGIARDLLGQPEAALVDLKTAFELTPSEGEVADLFIQFLLRYGHLPQANLVYEQHRASRGGAPDPQVTVPPRDAPR